MFCKATLVAVALALISSASPVVQEEGHRVTSYKRSTLTNPDGTFDHERAIHQAVRTHNKHRQNLVNLAANEVRTRSTLPILASSGSELYLGGTDTSLYTGAIEYHTVTGSGFWQASGAKVYANNNLGGSGFQTVIDSGTTIMYGPPSAVKAFYAQVPGSQVYDSSNGFYSFPCNSVPKVAFNWGGKNWTVSAANFNLGKTSSTSNQCVGALAGENLGLGNNVWLLGDSFMKNVYSVFSFDKNSVGFATLS
ncbi:predicted protein [Postia placenta Mad-698-R]|nr:predicted protein [Postia placenta Mad-698-R]